MVKKTRLIGLIIIMTATVVFAQRNGVSQSGKTSSIDLKPRCENVATLNPLAAVFENLTASYEHLFGDKNGAMFQGGLFFKGGYGIAAHSRYYYRNAETRGSLNAPFIGAFVSYEKSQDEVNVDSGAATTIYNIETKCVKVGLNWGERWAVSEKMSMAFRVGYGYPFMAKFKWPEPKPTNADSAEKKKKLFGGIDAELSFGYMF